MQRGRWPSAGQVRGMLLEEALLALLYRSGYSSVYEVGNDPTLDTSSAGLCVKGRGERHQIDAIADYAIQQPFCNPQRLLLEAKCYDLPINLGIVRNAVGVLKDVSEYWHNGVTGSIAKSRYHYTYSIFSASGFSAFAQHYAYAQDIYLIPLDNSAFMVDILQAIWNFAPHDREIRGLFSSAFRLGDLRKAARVKLSRQLGIPMPSAVRVQLPDDVSASLDTFFSACREIRTALLATINGRFPVLLVSSPDIDVRSLPSQLMVEIRWTNRSWYLDHRDRGRLFSFDLPRELFLAYAETGMLSERVAVEMKGRELNEFQAVYIEDGIPRLMQFRLDEQWLWRVREQLGE